METKQKTIVMCGGGTLGPVTPLLAVASEIRRSSLGTKIVWVGTHAGPERAIVEQAGYAFHSVSSGKFRRYFSFANVIDVFRIKLGFFQAFALLGRLHPDAVVSAGGFVAVPVVWAAWLRRIPVHVHQQDPIPGLANRLSVRFAASVSVALERSVADFAPLVSGTATSKGSPVWTGNPVRVEVLAGSRSAAMKAFGLEVGVPTVLVLGGGTGAAGLNALVAGALSTIVTKAQVIHSTGIGKKVDVASPRYHQYEIITTDMPHALAVADVVVTRAGMGTLSELAALGKPTIIVPMPASHQDANARLFAKAGAAFMLDERATDSAAFAGAILGLLADANKRTELSTAILRMNRPDAAARIAATILSLVNTD